jgi:hypothetical protein
VDGGRALIIRNEEEYQGSVIAPALRCGLPPISCFNAEGTRTLLLHKDVGAVLCSDILPDGGFQAKKSVSEKALLVKFVKVECARLFPPESHILALDEQPTPWQGTSSAP